MEYIKNIKKKKLYKIGSESIIYECNLGLYKKILNKNNIENKENKLLLLDKNNDLKKYYNKVLGIVKNKGYIIEKVNGIQLYKYNGNNRISILKELKEILELFKTYNIYYLDFNLGNVFITYEGLKLIDIDNIKIDNYDIDLLPILYQKYYELGGTDINKAIIFVFNILSVLFIENKTNFYNIKQIKNYEYLDYEIINDIAYSNINSTCDNTYLIDKLK